MFGSNELDKVRKRWSLGEDTAFVDRLILEGDDEIIVFGHPLAYLDISCCRAFLIAPIEYEVLPLGIAEPASSSFREGSEGGS